MKQTMRFIVYSKVNDLNKPADYDTLIRIADYFDVSIDYLLERTNNPARFL